MLRHFLLCVFCLGTGYLQAQVGINTNSPRAVLDVVSINDTGLVYPRVASVESVTANGDNATPALGTAVFDQSRNRVCYLVSSGTWVCSGINGSGDVEVSRVDTAGSMAAPTKANGQQFTEGHAVSTDLNFLATTAISSDGTARLDIFKLNADLEYEKLTSFALSSHIINPTLLLSFDQENQLLQVRSKHKIAEKQTYSQFTENSYAFNIAGPQIKMVAGHTGHFKRK